MTVIQGMGSSEPSPMSDQKSSSRGRIRYRLRTLIAAMAFVAFVLVVSRNLYDWYTSTPLEAAVSAFNTRAGLDPIGKHEPPLSGDEVVAAIQRRVPTLGAGPRVKAIYSRIARTRRLPRGASLSSNTTYATGNGLGKTEQFTVWWVNLDVMTGPQIGYSLRIRETDDPVVTLSRSVDGVARSITKLSLSSREIAGDELPLLLRGHTDVQDLDLSHNPLSDEALMHLQPLQGLEVIRLAHTGVTDKGLANLKNLPRLREVHLYRGPGHRTTAAGRRQLREAIPGLKMPFITH